MTWMPILLLTVLGLAPDQPATQTVELLRERQTTISARWAVGRPIVIEIRSPVLANVAQEELLGRVPVFATDFRGQVEPGQAPLLGAVERLEDGRLVRFTSRFPAERGMSYHVRVDGLGLRRGGDFAARFVAFEIPARAPGSVVTATTVTRVAPAAEVLPDNLLKFYIEFSAPMSRGEAYDHLQLLDGAGKPIDLPFLELGEELWNPSHTRFTVLFDPGRIKSGLKPREEAGPVLEAGKRYTLVVGPGWHDAEGQPLAHGFRKPFRVVKADMTPPDPASWTIERPAAGGRAPLRVRFPEPLDRALLGRLLAVADGQGQPIAGTGRVADDERSWDFQPREPWQPGAHALLVGRELEDLAGNSIGRPFEVDAFEPIQRRVVAETVRLPFQIGP